MTNLNQYNREEALLKEVLVGQKTDAEIGMPDVEDELRRFRAHHPCHTPAAPAVPLHIGRLTQLWQRIAAVILALIVVGGLSWAAVTVYQLFRSDTLDEYGPRTTEVSRIDTPEPDLPIVAPAPAAGVLVYQKAELGYILSQLSQRYGLAQPDYQQASLAHIRLHVTLPDSPTVQEPIEVLNHFGKFHIEVRDQKIYVSGIAR